MDAGTGLVHLGHGRFYAPALGRPLQPHSAAAPPTIPQALNRYAATPVGQPGVYTASSGGGGQAGLWNTTKSETVEGVIGFFLGEGMDRYAQTASYGRLLATPKNVMRSGHSHLFRPYYGRTNTFSNRNHHISRPVSPIGRATYQDRAGAVISMGNNPHRFILGADDGFKRWLGGKWAQELTGGLIIEVAFAIPDIMEPWNNPYLDWKQQATQNVVTFFKIPVSIGAGAGAVVGIPATIAYITGAPVTIPATGLALLGIGAGIAVDWLWDMFIPPTVSRAYVFLGRQDPYQNIRNLRRLE